MEMSNSHYINIVEKTSGVTSENYVLDTNNTQEIIEGIIRKYDRHPSILKVKNNFVSSITFEFPKAEVADINALVEQTDPKKATGPDTIPPKLVKMSANVVDKHLCNIINMDIDTYIPDSTKVATVKLFDCIPHDFLIAKTHAYGFSTDTLKIFFSYLKGRKQNVEINNTYNPFQVLLYGVLHRSVLGQF